MESASITGSAMKSLSRAADKRPRIAGNLRHISSFGSVVRLQGDCSEQRSDPVSFLFHGCGTQMSMPLLNVSFVDHDGRQCDPEEGTGCLRKSPTSEMAIRLLSSVGT